MALNHEGKRREEEKENILLTWKVSQVRSVDVCKYRYEAGGCCCCLVVACSNLSFTRIHGTMCHTPQRPKQNQYMTYYRQRTHLKGYFFGWRVRERSIL